MKLLLASSNPGKFREYLEMASGADVEIQLLPNFSQLPAFEESAPTFAENAAGKALHYSRIAGGETVLTDDSGLVVPALGGAPGVQSARYGGPGASDADRIQKLLKELNDKEGSQRRARFVCVIAIAVQGRAIAVISDFALGTIAKEPRGTAGFGYDSVFLLEELRRTYAELTPEQKNAYSHRGRAFRKLLYFIEQ